MERMSPAEMERQGHRNHSSTSLDVVYSLRDFADYARPSEGKGLNHGRAFLKRPALPLMKYAFPRGWPLAWGNAP